MKHMAMRILTAMVFLGLGANAWAAGLAISQDRLELGNLKEGVKAERVVTLTNQGAEAVHVANVTTSCSCTTTKLGQVDLKPGEDTTLTITYNTWKFPGKFEKYVTLFTGPQGKTEQVITLLGYVDPVPMGVLEVSPRKLDVGDLAVGQDSVKELVLSNTGDAALTVTKVYSKKFGSVYFDAAQAGKPLEITAGANQGLKLTLNPTKAGKYLDYVMVEGEARNITDNGFKVVVVGQAQ